MTQRGQAAAMRDMEALEAWDVHHFISGKGRFGKE